MGKLRPIKSTHLAKATQSWSGGTMNLDPESLALAPYPLPASSIISKLPRTALSWGPSIWTPWPHSLGLKVDVSTRVDLKWVSFLRPKMTVNVSSHLNSAHVPSGKSGYGTTTFHVGVGLGGKAERQDGWGRGRQHQILLEQSRYM